MPTPTVSVIVPVYNRAHLVSATLRSLMGQTRPADEIIVVDDGSTDGSGDLARSFDGPLRVITIANSGPARARNAGLAEARGEFVQFFDSDDLATPDFLESRLEAIQHSKSDIAYGPWAPIGINGDTIKGDGFVRQTAKIDRPLDAFLNGWVLFIPDALIRRSLIQDVGGYPEDLVTGEDMSLLFNLLCITDRLVHTPQSLLLVRQHPSGQISASPDLFEQRLRDELILTDTVLSEIGTNMNAKIVPSPAAVRAWKFRRMRASVAVMRAENDVRKTRNTLPNLGAKFMMQGNDILKRIADRFRFMRYGHRISGHYSPAEWNTSHTRLLGRMGYSVEGGHDDFAKSKDRTPDRQEMSRRSGSIQG